MDLEIRKAEIEKRVDEINAQRQELYKQLNLTAQEFLKLQGEYRLIDEMLQEASTTVEKNNGEVRSED